ncbi:MAG TPA: GNAT family N-acetyltransferase [Dysgonomonas sp.]|nr:GNAT family N-acetyltransferase [Dysgonomonas sp.]
MEIIVANTEHSRIIWDIAVVTWADTYKNILSKEQMDYMLDMMYSPGALEEQMNRLGHHFYLIKEEKSPHWQGFVSYEYDYKESNSTKLHKLYVLPECHGLGMGRILIDKVCEDARRHGNESVLLNMNRNNETLGFYKHLGFEIIAEEDIDIGNGYLMEDYIFERKV